MRKRHTSLNANEKTYSKKLIEVLNKVIKVADDIVDDIDDDDDDDEDGSMDILECILWGALIIILEYLRINEHEILAHSMEVSPNRNRTFDSFSESECWSFFRTQRKDLSRLQTALRIPDMVILENRGKISGEELLLRGMFELVSGNNQHNISVLVFGRDQSVQSRAFTYFIDHIYSNLLFLVSDSLEWWYSMGYLEKSMKAIKKKINGNDNFTTCGFIDCNCLECPRPGGGPRDEGHDSERWDPNIQRSFYNGWKSIHGLKHQTLDTAFGITIEVFGPFSLRRNDLMLLKESMINSRLRDIQLNSPAQLTLYGDSIYPILSHVRGAVKNSQATNIQKQENSSYSKVRISIEWNYSATANLFKYLANLGKLKLLSEARVSKVFTVATILRNFHVCLYGSQTSNYFDIVIPNNFLEIYARL